MASWRNFLREAQRFWQVAEAANELEHINQAASMAIHAVIAANDAVCLYRIGERSGGQSHSQAAQLLQQACKGTEWEGEAVRRSRHFTQIVQEKNAAEYEGRPIGAERAGRVMKRAKRFLDWAERVLPPVLLAGEDD